MGLKRFTGDKSKATTLRCLVIGEDRMIMHRYLQSTGAYVLDDKNRLAFDTLPEAVGSLTAVRNGKVKHLGHVSLLFESMFRPYSFPSLDWANIEHKEDIVLACALAEGCSKAIQRIERSDRFEKLSTILLLLAAGVIGMAFLFAVQSGIFSRLIGH